MHPQTPDAVKHVARNLIESGKLSPEGVHRAKAILDTPDAEMERQNREWLREHYPTKSK